MQWIIGIAVTWLALAIIPIAFMIGAGIVNRRYDDLIEKHDALAALRGEAANDAVAKEDEVAA